MAAGFFFVHNAHQVLQNANLWGHFIPGVFFYHFHPLDLAPNERRAAWSLPLSVIEVKKEVQIFLKLINGAAIMNLWVWLPAMIILGLAVMAIMFAFLKGCEKV